MNLGESVILFELATGCVNSRDSLLGCLTVQLDDQTAGTVWQMIPATSRAAEHRQPGNGNVDPRNLFVEIDESKIERPAAIAAVESLHMVFRRKDICDVHSCS